MNIDKRVKEKDKIYVLLDNGQKILLPPMVTQVPALLMLNRGNQIIFGNDVLNFYKPMIKEEKQKATIIEGNLWLIHLLEKWNNNV